jgi:gluconolactonase
VVVVERRGLQRVFPDGSREWIVETLGPGGGDGFCLDADGRFYVASTIEHGVRVVDPDGTVAEFLPIEGDGLTTNCCFGGADMRTLFVTDALPGNLVAFEGMPAPGLPLPPWPAPATP